MTEVSQLVLTIKRQLKTRGLTYRDVAAELGISEPSVKRLFATQRFTLARLADLGNLLGFTLAELVQEASASSLRIRTLTEDQERQLVADARLLLTAVCVLNHWAAADIVARYRFTQAECLKRLLVLDRMGLIELLPGDRIRPKVARDFDWLPDGPIRVFFRNQGQADFLSERFDGESETLAFVHGMLTESAQAQLTLELRRMRTRLAVLHEESLQAPLSQRHGVGLFLAMREWEPMSFRELRRKPGA